MFKQPGHTHAKLNKNIQTFFDEKKLDHNKNIPYSTLPIILFVYTNDLPPKDTLKDTWTCLTNGIPSILQLPVKRLGLIINM